nr:class I SAM-dependent methyltransferase [Vulcanisaeta sp. JCM 14467]
MDLCSGVGIGGIALAKVLAGLGIKVDLTLVDLRQSALDKARRFGLRELGFEPRVIIHNVLEEMALGEKFDIALIWGLTTPHFSPWNWIKVLINVWQLLTDDGIFMYEESDRIYAIQHVTGYREVNPEIVEKDRVVLTIYKDRDFRSGYETRLVLNLITNEREELKVYFWDLASSAAFTWIFFNDVDFIPTRRPYTGAVIARNPRRTFDLKALFSQKPSILKQVQ